MQTYVERNLGILPAELVGRTWPVGVRGEKKC